MTMYPDCWNLLMGVVTLCVSTPCLYSEATDECPKELSSHSWNHDHTCVYLTVHSYSSWFDSRQACQEYGADLISPFAHAKLDVVQAYLEDLPGETDIWVGGQSEKINWTWIYDGKQAFDIVLDQCHQLLDMWELRRDLSHLQCAFWCKNNFRSSFIQGSRCACSLSYNSLQNCPMNVTEGGQIYQKLMLTEEPHLTWEFDAKHPDRLFSEDCALVSIEYINGVCRLILDVGDCYQEKHSALCQFNASRKCSDTGNVSSSYIEPIGSKDVTWLQSYQACHEEGGRLAQFHVQTFVCSLETYQTLFRDETFWIGLTRLRWSFTQDEEIFNSSSNLNNEQLKDGRCLAMGPGLYSKNCTEYNLHGLCEIGCRCQPPGLSSTSESVSTDVPVQVNHSSPVPGLTSCPSVEPFGLYIGASVGVGVGTAVLMFAVFVVVLIKCRSNNSTPMDNETGGKLIHETDTKHDDSEGDQPKDIEREKDYVQRKNWANHEYGIQDRSGDGDEIRYMPQRAGKIQAQANVSQQDEGRYRRDAGEMVGHGEVMINALLSPYSVVNKPHRSKYKEASKQRGSGNIALRNLRENRTTSEQEETEHSMPLDDGLSPRLDIQESSELVNVSKRKNPGDSNLPLVKLFAEGQDLQIRKKQQPSQHPELTVRGRLYPHLDEHRTRNMERGMIGDYDRVTNQNHRIDHPEAVDTVHGHLVGANRSIDGGSTYDRLELPTSMSGYGRPNQRSAFNAGYPRFQNPAGFEDNFILLPSD